MKKRLHLLITGKVQGVFFRDNTQKKAQSLGLTGWVKNNSNGCVEVVAEGDENNLKKLLEFCQKGPEQADVKDLKVEWHQYKNEFTQFKINNL